MKAIDLFAGPGGWDVAARDLGLDVLGIEIDPMACATRRAAGLATIEADVRALDPLDYPAAGLIASPPCQTFSIAGKGAGRAQLDLVLDAVRAGERGEDFVDERTALVLEPLRWILARCHAGRPYLWIAMEQVPPVLLVWQAYAEVLTNLGYSVATGILNAEQYGVPQTRRRAVLVARLGGEARLPAPTHSRYYVRDKDRQDSGVLPWVSMAEALDWGMTARPGFAVTVGTAAGGIDPACVGGSGARRTLYAERDEGRWKFCATNIRPNAAQRDSDEPAPTLAFGHEKPRWIHERPATTVNCDPRISKPGRHVPGDPLSAQQRDAIRVTAVEAAILQTFPAGYPFQGLKGQVFQQIGNAVPPLLARAILATLIEDVAVAAEAA